MFLTLRCCAFAGVLLIKQLIEQIQLDCFCDMPLHKVEALFQHAQDGVHSALTN